MDVAERRDLKNIIGLENFCESILKDVAKGIERGYSYENVCIYGYEDVLLLNYVCENIRSKFISSKIDCYVLTS